MSLLDSFCWAKKLFYIVVNCWIVCVGVSVYVLMVLGLLCLAAATNVCGVYVEDNFVCFCMRSVGTQSKEQHWSTQQDWNI